MANIDLQKKQSSGKGWLWGLLAAAGVIALVIFFIFNGEPGDDEVGAEVELSGAAATEGPWEPLEEPDDDRAATTASATEGSESSSSDRDESGSDSSESFPIAAVMDSPAEWEGRTVEGEVRVLEVPTDRGFWVEEDGERAFFVVDPEGRESDAHIQQGQRIRISGAKVHRGTDDLTGRLVAEAQEAVANEPVFFVVDPEDFEIL